MVHVWCECEGAVVKWLRHQTFDQNFEWEIHVNSLCFMARPTLMVSTLHQPAFIRITFYDAIT